jgi:hypothetical protein
MFASLVGADEFQSGKATDVSGIKIIDQYPRQKRGDGKSRVIR